MNWGRLFFDVDVTTGVSRRGRTMRRRTSWPGPLFWTRGGWRRNLALLTSQLNAIVRCNAPLVTGLEKAIADGPSLKLMQAMIALSDDLSSGMRLADAMAQCPRFYPPWYIDLIRAGESTGSLERALSAAGAHLATSHQFRKSMSGWFAYIGCVLMFQITVAVFLFTYLVPEFAELLHDFGGKLPTTLIVIGGALDSIRVEHVRVVVLVCVGLLVLLWRRRLAGERRLRLHRLLGPLPFFGAIVAKRHLVSVCGVIEQLAAANVPANEMLGDCAALDVSGEMRRALLRAQARVEQGQALGDALRPEGAFPHSFVTILALGEASGKLGDAARHLRSMYETQVISSVRTTVQIAGPVGILGLGAVALAIYGGIFSALVSISDLLINSI